MPALGHLTAHCRDSEPMRTWRHEWLLGRPKKEDSLLGRRRDVQGSGGPYLLRKPILCKAIRREGTKGRIFGPEEEARIRSEAGRQRHEALGGRPQGAPLREPSGTLRVHRSHHGTLG